MKVVKIDGSDLPSIGGTSHLDGHYLVEDAHPLPPAQGEFIRYSLPNVNSRRVARRTQELIEYLDRLGIPYENITDS